jgi:hypothetical protein
MAIELVDFPINSMVIFHSYVSLPEGMFKIPKRDIDRPHFYGHQTIIHNQLPKIRSLSTEYVPTVNSIHGCFNW